MLSFLSRPCFHRPPTPWRWSRCAITRATIAAGALAAAAATPVFAQERLALMATEDETPYEVTMCDSISDYRAGECRVEEGVLDRGEVRSVDMRSSEGEEPVYFERSTSNLLSTQPPDNDRIFRDSFEAEIKGLDTTLDGAVDYHTETSIIGPVTIPCGEEHASQLIAAPKDWDWTYEYDNPSPDEIVTDELGFIQYTPPCDGEDEATLVASATSSQGEARPVGVWYEIDKAPELSGLDYDNDGVIDNAVVDGNFESALEVACGGTENFWIVGSAESYSLTDAPSGMSLAGDQVTYEAPSCTGSYTDSVGVNAHRDGQTESAGLAINVNAVGDAPVIEGLNYTFNNDSLVDNYVGGGALEEAIEYLCGPNRERQTQIVGEADSYELINTPDGMTLEDDIITYAPPGDEACDDENGIESTVTIRAHRNGQTEDVSMTNYAMNPRIKCVTHYTQTSGGTPITNEHCDTNESGSIDGIIELSYDNTFHEIHLNVRPSLEKYTPPLFYSYEGNNIPESFMSLDTADGIIYASPDSGDEGDSYFTSVKAENGAKETSWKNIKFEVVE